MVFTISFFKSRNLEKIDYAEVILYFEKELNCKVSYSDEDVKMEYHDRIFDIDYQFMITKRSRVSNLALLNPEFVNIRFLVEIPLVIPEQVSRQIITIIEKVCNRFNLAIYYEGLNDVEPLDIVKLMKTLHNERRKVLSSLTDDLYFIDNVVLSHIANYHQVLDYINNNLNENLTLSKYQLLSDGESNNILLASTFKLDSIAVIPPHLDYLIVLDKDVHQYLPTKIFYKKALKYMVVLKDYIPDADLLYINEKYTHKISRIIRRLSKYYVHDKSFVNIEINNIIER